ncbi:MAG: class III poly(R)-hydroxyalkanoic acid synthase subunit PhaC [Desulfobulbaceae bacterium]|nr:class III poly(R)-hydroxyalkanoic acid synthase subunit PhaC [Desulfobulbaceae bacterium]
MENKWNMGLEPMLEEMAQMQEKMIKGAEVLMNINFEGSDQTEKSLVYQEDKMRLYHYKATVKKPCKIPALIVYALVNRHYMMDIDQEKSFIKKLLDSGLDLYLIDWGYPTAEDRYLTLEDYINGYIDNAIDYIRKEHKLEKVNLIGVCQGGTFSTIYAALHPDKIKNLVTMVTPVDFGVEDGLLIKWSKAMNVDNIVDTYGVVPGSFMNYGFLLLKPYGLMIDKYIGVIDKLDDPDSMANFLRMEKWIFDSPAQAGEAFRRFLKECYQENKLIKGELIIGNSKVNLKNITMPLLNMLALYDHLVPPSATRPLNDAVGSEDKELMEYPVGHIGMYVSSRAQKEVAPKLSSWLQERSK